MNYEEIKFSPKHVLVFGYWIIFQEVDLVAVKYYGI